MDLSWLSLDAQSVFVSLAVLLAIWLYRTTRLPRDFPPGPRPWPVIGNLPLMGKDPKRAHVVLAELAKQYGPVIGIKLGSHPTVILANYEVIHEALVRKADAFSGRPHFLYVINQLATVEGKLRGVIWQEGQPWKDSRRFTLMALRDFGMGKRSIEERIQEEGGAMCSQLLQVSGKPFEITKLSQQAISNVICSIVFGSRFEYTDPAFTKMMQLVNFNVSLGLFQTLGNFFPFLRFLPFFNIKKVLDNSNQLRCWIRELINQHRETFDPENIRDFADIFLQKEQEEESKDSGLSANMFRIIIELFVAGTETTSTTLRWIILYMIRYPEIQKRCQNEIDNHIGSGRSPSLSDRPKVPYVHATIQETLRLGNIVPLSVPHKTMEDTSMAGYRIPKNTMVYVNTYAVHMDPELWEEPEKFNPDRWLGAEGKVEKKDAFIPFSTGPRICAGQTLAENETFIFFVMLLQRFNLRMLDSSRPPSMQGNMGITLAPEAYQFIAEPRK